MKGRYTIRSIFEPGFADSRTADLSAVEGPELLSRTSTAPRPDLKISTSISTGFSTRPALPTAIPHDFPIPTTPRLPLTAFHPTRAERPHR